MVDRKKKSIEDVKAQRNILKDKISKNTIYQSISEDPSMKRILSCIKASKFNKFESTFQFENITKKFLYFSVKMIDQIKDHGDKENEEYLRGIIQKYICHLYLYNFDKDKSNIDWERYHLKVAQMNKRKIAKINVKILNDTSIHLSVYKNYIYFLVALIILAICLIISSLVF